MHPPWLRGLPRLSKILLELGDLVLKHGPPRLGDRPLVGLVVALGLEGLDGLLEEGGIGRAGVLRVATMPPPSRARIRAEEDVAVHG